MPLRPRVASRVGSLAKTLLAKRLSLLRQRISSDNMAARDLAYNPEHHARTKHVERRRFYILATW